MISPTLINIFRNGSKTYFYSSLFFPSAVRADVFALYCFVRTIDDFVDTLPQQTKELQAFLTEYRQAVRGKKSQNIVITEFVKIQKKHHFDQSWIDAFISAMKQDLSKSKYQTIQETERYIYGSAEVVGLMMAKILQLPKKSYKYAQQLGKAMQLANFIRDLQEDIQLQRCYFPQNELKKFGLHDLSKTTATAYPDNFKRFMLYQIERYHQWQHQAEKGFSFIPKRYLIPIKTAGELYSWTVQKIADQPSVVFDKKIKPNISKILIQIVVQTFKT